MEKANFRTLFDPSIPLADAFLNKEDLIARGLYIYLVNVAGEYFDEEQINSLIILMRHLRSRSEKEEFVDSSCEPISEDQTIRNRFLPHKMLRKDELAILFYNLAPYALVSRMNMARVAKACFPNFFASTSTINSTFTKYQYKQETRKGREVALTIQNLSERNIADIDGFLLDLALTQDSE